MDQKVVSAVNKQINHEMYSAYLYLSMAAYCDSVNLQGFGSWMKVQAKEEMTHAMKFFEYLNDRGERVVLETIEKPPAEFTSAQDVFKKVSEHEQKVTALINKLYELSLKQSDHATSVLLQWYINEQVEEEKSAQEILAQLQLIKPDSAALLILDKQLGKRGKE